MKYASVRILDVPYQTDRVFEYAVPDELEDKVSVGSMIYVSFGYGSRKCKAVVTGLSCERGGDWELKNVLGVMNDAPVMTAEELALCKFLCDYTLCTFGEAAKCVIPAAAFSKIDYYYTVKEEVSKSRLDKMSEETLAVYSSIRRMGKVSSAKLRELAGERAGDIISYLIKCGAVEKIARVKEPTNVKYVDKVKLLVPLEKREDAEALCRRSPGQLEVLRVLFEGGDTDSETLSKIFEKNLRPQLSSLEKKGIIKLSRDEVFRNPYKNAGGGYTESPLSEEQQMAADKLNALLDTPEARAALLHGVTGSGKTRIMKAVIDHALSSGKGVIILVPEISLTPQTVDIFCSCYGERCAVIHSALSNGERYDAWRRIRNGDADVVIGTRSAVFAPVKNLGLIIIDEEQEHTYKSDTDPKYSAHDAARFRCGKSGALMLLSSATPSISSYHKAVTGAYTLVELKERYGDAKLPRVIISDMRDDRFSGVTSPIGSALADRLAEAKDEGNQSIVFLNRRGYNSAVSCRVCGEAMKCPNCSVSLTYHVRAPIGETDDAAEYFARRAERGSLSCHYCGFRSKVPSACPSCGAEHFRFVGCGTQMAEEEISKLLPGIKVSRMDMDTTSTKHSFDKILKGFRRGDADVLLGTQMVTKGHDFPNVTLVGVMNADASLYLDDYTASEKTFSMLTQVIGRAGRGQKEGVAVIQTCSPEADVIKLASKQDYRSFYEKEIVVRKALTFPPFCDIGVMNISGTDESMVNAGAKKLSEFIQSCLEGDFKDVEIIAFGPFEAPVYKVQNTFRMRMIFKCRQSKRTRMLFSHILREFASKTTKGITLTADFNPSSL